MKVGIKTVTFDYFFHSSVFAPALRAIKAGAPQVLPSMTDLVLDLVLVSWGLFLSLTRVCFLAQRLNIYGGYLKNNGVRIHFKKRCNPAARLLDSYAERRSVAKDADAVSAPRTASMIKIPASEVER